MELEDVHHLLGPEEPERPDPIILKAVIEGYTVDEMIAKLERLKVIGVPGDTMLNQTNRAAKAIKSAMEKDSNRMSIEDNNKIARAKVSLWLEYEA